MAEELTELNEETLYRDSSGSEAWQINTLSIDRNSDLYRTIVNDSLPFYFVNQYQDATIRSDRDEQKLLFVFGRTEFYGSYIYSSDAARYRLTTSFAHAIDPRFAKEGKLLPGAILPVLQYHAN